MNLLDELKGTMLSPSHLSSSLDFLSSFPCPDRNAESARPSLPSALLPLRPFQPVHFAEILISAFASSLLDFDSRFRSWCYNICTYTYKDRRIISIALRWIILLTVNPILISLLPHCYYHCHGYILLSLLFSTIIIAIIMITITIYYYVIIICNYCTYYTG